MAKNNEQQLVINKLINRVQEQSRVVESDTRAKAPAMLGGQNFFSKAVSNKTSHFNEIPVNEIPVHHSDADADDDALEGSYSPQ